jgi:hypothetical protein
MAGAPHLGSIRLPILGNAAKPDRLPQDGVKSPYRLDHVTAILSPNAP